MSNDVTLSIGAEDQGVKAAFDKISASVSDSSKAISDSMSGVHEALSRVSEKIKSFTSALSDTSAIKDQIDSTREMATGADELSDSLGRVGNSAVAQMFEHLDGIMESLSTTLSGLSEAVEKQGKGFLHAGAEIANMVVAGKSAVDLLDRLSKPRDVMPGVADNLKKTASRLDELKAASQSAFAPMAAKAEEVAQSMGTRLSAAISSAGSAARACVTPMLALAAAMLPIAVIAAVIYAAFKLVEAGVNAFVNGALSGGMLESTSEKLSKAGHELEQFADKLGQAQPNAQALMEVLSVAGKKTDDYIAGTENLRNAISKNEKEFNSFGVATRDSTGHLRDQSAIAADTAKALKGLADDGSRAWEMNRLGVSSMEQLKAVASATPEAIAAMNKHLGEYRVLIGEDAVVATERYNDALRAYKAENDLTWRGVSNMISQAVMPAFTDMLEWFKGGMPFLADITHWAMTKIMSGWYAMVMKVVWAKEMIQAAIESITPGMSSLADAFTDLIHGNFTKSMDHLAAAKNQAADKFAAANKRIEDQEQKFAARMAEYAKAGTTGADQHVGGKNTGNRAEHDDAKGGADKSRMPEWEAELAGVKVFFQKQYELKEYSKQQEKEYWQSILDNVKISGDERIAITRKVSTLELEIMKKQMEQRKALDAEAINAHEKTAEDGIKLEEMLSQREYDLGNINKQQLLALQQQYEDRRFEIQQEAQAARISAMLNDPNMDPVALQKLLDQMGEIQRKYAMNSVKISSDMAVESRTGMEKMIAPISSAFDKSITGMIQGTLTLKKALGNIFNAILAEFVNLGVQMVTKWAAMELAKTAATQKGSVIRAVLEKMGLIDTAAAQVSASATTATAKTAEAAVVVPAQAAEAAGGAASAVAGIPIVGPAMAIAAFAAVMAMVKGGLRSASGGFDIPSGVNPMTQLHAEEMVLPAHIANPLRDSLAGGGSGGGINVHITAMDSQDVHRALMNGGALHKAMKNMQRNFQR